MKKNKTSKSWVIKQHRDQFFKRSKIEGYRSRSAFKLIEMNSKFKLINKNSLLLDLGSSPGGWSQVSSNIITKGKILSIDKKIMKNIKKVNFIKGDFTSKDTQKEILNYFGEKINLVMSDMAASTSGNKDMDSYQTGELCLKAIDFAAKILNKEGVFLGKVFMGSIFNEVHKKAKKTFKKVINYKPAASRKESREIYIYCKGAIEVL